LNNYLQSFLTAHDRGGYYMARYNMTGSQEALLQAQIATFSEGPGAAAYIANSYLKEIHPSIYQANIYNVSQQVAESSLKAIEKKINDDANNANTGIITDAEMLKSAQDAWVELEMGNLFPGNVLLAQNGLKALLASKGAPLLEPLPAAQLFASKVIDILTNGGYTDLSDFAQFGLTEGALAGLVAALGGGPLMGKQIGDYQIYPDLYDIVELPDAAYRVAIDKATHKVLGVFAYEALPTLETIEAAFTEMWPQIVAGFVNFPAFITVTAIMEVLSSVLVDIRREHTQTGEFGIIKAPVQSAATEGNDTLWGEGGFVSFMHDNTINGGAGDDRIFGGDGDDILHGDVGNDILYGQDNNDTSMAMRAMTFYGVA
jgi:RTX calcium-binding nonapeptide repeat (4 copies)